MKKQLKKINIWPLLLAAIAVVLCILNYTPDTFLSGWDTLHPEFNFSLNFQRIFNGIWRQEQGLGALAGHAHMSEFPRLIFLWISSLVFPMDFLRYFFFFACLIFGPLGVYFYLNKNNFKNIPAFLGGLFYLLNLGTLQHFFVPFEMFAVLYAALPWLLLFAGKFLEKGEKKYLLWFSAVTFLSSSMAYASVLWFAYFGFLILFISASIISTKKREWKKGLVLIGITLILNSYWFIPNLYFLVNSAKNVSLAKTNLMFSEKAFETDEKYANFKDAALLKGFLFDWQKYDGEKFTFLLKDWKEHLSNPIVSTIGYILFSFVLLGILSTIVKREKRYLVFLPGFIFAFIFLVHGALGIKEVFDFLRNNLNVFKESLRFPWTKFSIFVMFGYSVFFAMGLESVFKIVKQKKILITVLSVIICALLTIWILPAFKGKLISPLMRIKIPSEYFEMYKWFEQKPADERIAVLPLSTYWGWEYYRFGYEGAGFVWFGLKQPVLVRDFDRWQPENENFYWELSYAIDSKNNQAFENVFEKYQISWIMLDGNIVNPAWPMTVSQSELQEMIDGRGLPSAPSITLRINPLRAGKPAKTEIYKFELAATFGKIKIYKVNLETPVKDFVWLGNNLPVVNDYQWGNLDVGFGKYGGYVDGRGLKSAKTISAKQDSNQQSAVSNQQYDAFYPFRSLFTGRKIDELNAQIEDLGDKFVFKAKLPEGLEDYVIELPKDYEGKELVEIDPGNYDTKYFLPTIDSDRKVFSVSFPKIKGLLSAEIDPSKQNLQLINCNQFSQGKVGLENKTGKIELEAEDANNCGASFYLPSLSHKYAYLISAEAKNIEGKPLLFWMENLTNRKADQEIYLDSAETTRVIQPPMAEDGIGYTLHFDNISIGREKTVNELGKIGVNLIPYRFLTELKLVQSSKFKVQNQISNLKTEDITVNHLNPATYEINISSNILIRKESPCFGKETPCMQNILVLSQAYHEGWKAYEMTNDQFPNTKQYQIIKFLKQNLPFFFGKEIKEHVVVNNWENGWNLPSNPYSLTPTTYVIVFWPQYLEYLGFGLMGICLFVIAGFNLCQKSAD